MISILAIVLNPVTLFAIVFFCLALKRILEYEYVAGVTYLILSLSITLGATWMVAEMHHAFASEVVTALQPVPSSGAAHE